MRAPDLDALTEPPLDRLTAVCPRCRRLVRADSACELDGSGALAPSDPASRDRLVDATWGSMVHRDELRRQVTQRAAARRARNGMIAFTAGALLGYVTQPYAMAGLFGGAVGGALGFAASARPILIPTDAVELPSWPVVVGRGRVIATREIVAPGSLDRCVAWSLELRYQGSWGTRTTLRAGATAGFDVHLDGGDHVRVPSGAIWLADRLVQVDGDDAIVDELIRHVDPLGAESSWPLFPFNVIVQKALSADDRVEVLDAVEPRPIRTDDARLFRDAPPTMLFHTSLPIVRIV
jgi:hypothetical protein